MLERAEAEYLRVRCGDSSGATAAEGAGAAAREARVCEAREDVDWRYWEDGSHPSLELHRALAEEIGRRIERAEAAAAVAAGTRHSEDHAAAASAAAASAAAASAPVVSAVVSAAAAMAAPSGELDETEEARWPLLNRGEATEEDAAPCAAPRTVTKGGDAGHQGCAQTSESESMLRYRTPSTPSAL